MKAKFIALAGIFEMVLANGTVFTSTDGEKKPAFLKRVKDSTSLDVGDLEISELTVDSFNKFSLIQLNAAKDKNEGLILKLIEEAIKLKEKEVADKTNAKDSAKEIAAKAKAEAATKKAEEKAIAKAAKDAAKADKPSLESVLAAAAEAKKNVGHAISFKPQNFATNIDGIINGVWVDRRVPMALYRIYDADDKMYNKVINSPDFTIGELMPNPKAEQQAKAKAEKEAVKAGKIELAAKNKAEKEAEKEAAIIAKKEAADKAILVKQEKAKLAEENKAKTASEKLTAAEEKKAKEIEANKAKTKALADKALAEAKAAKA